MSIEKITLKVSEIGQQGLKKLPETGKKLDTVIDDGTKKLAATLDSMAQTMKVRVSKKINKHKLASKIKKTKSDTALEIARLNEKAKTSIKSDLKGVVSATTKNDNVLKGNAEYLKELFDNYTPNATKELEYVQNLSHKSAQESAQTFINQFEETKAAKELARIQNLSGKSAQESSWVFELNGKTEAEKIAQQAELKAKLMDKYGTELAQKQKIAQTKARLQEKFKNE